MRVFYFLNALMLLFVVVVADVGHLDFWEECYFFLLLCIWLSVQGHQQHKDQCQSIGGGGEEPKETDHGTDLFNTTQNEEQYERIWA